jgi:hypothetical protein
MSADVASPDSGYTNRAPIRAQAERCLRRDDGSGRHAGGRAVDRVRLTLHAYEQREARRAELYAWVVARAAFSSGLSSGA